MKEEVFEEHLEGLKALSILADYGNRQLTEVLEKDKEIERLNNKYNKALELLSDYNMPCEYDEGKIPDNYCEENCDVDDETYKKCWDKYIELELKGDSSNE